MFQYVIDKYFPNLTVNNTNLYIGDAAGRPKKDSKKKDFADTDYKFALNSKMSFLTPEEYFLQNKQTIPEITNMINSSLVITKKEKERRE